MNESDKNPDELWRSVFDDAAETPPPRVWDAIERRLDEPDEASIVPLWGAGFFSKQSVSWGMGVAATAALLLVGWWVSQSPDGQESIAHHQAKSVITSPQHPDAVAMNQSTNERHSSSKQQQRNDAVTSDEQTTQINSSRLTQVRLPKTIDPIRSSDQLAQQTQPASSRPSKNKSFVNGVTDSPVSRQIVMDAPADQTAATVVLTPLATQSFSAETASDALEEGYSYSKLAALPEKLDPRPMKLRSAGPIHRIVWVKPYEAPQEPALTESKRSSREHWVSLNVMPNSFNPAVSVQASQPTLASAYGFRIANSSQPPVKNRAELSVSYQANAGLQLNDHWSVESGIGYLAGHATIDSPAQPNSASMLSFGGTGMPVNTLYTEVLQQSVQRTTVASADMVNNWAASSAYNSLYAYDPQTRQTLTNDYQFVQVPIQVGYQLRPRKRLGLALLGGFLTNIFLRNTVENQLVIKPEDGIYQPVTLAAAMGARFQYRSSQRWSASLAGMYQPTLGSATKSGSNVQSHPTSAGMSFGVDYHF